MPDDLAPSIRLEVEGHELRADIVNYVTRAEVEQTRDIADAVKITVVNRVKDQIGRGVTFNEFDFINSKIFQPGNTVKVWMGFGRGKEGFVGAGIIQKFLPNFPNAGIPELSIEARDGSVLLMDGDDVNDARTFPEVDFDVIVADLCGRKGIQPGDVDTLKGSATRSLVKKQGMSDYQFIKGVANLAGYEFKVYWDEVADCWRFKFRKPRSDQTNTLTFEYGGFAATLLSFAPEWGLRDTPTDVAVLYFDKDSGTWEKVFAGDEADRVQEKQDAALAKAAKAKKASTRRKRAEAADSLKFDGREVSKVTKEITNLSTVRIAAGGVAVEVVPERPFKSADEAQRFAERWLRARRDLFITGRGRTIGYELLRPGDVHILDGVGTQLSGRWEFTTVRHLYSRESFTTEFFANKELSQ